MKKKKFDKIWKKKKKKKFNKIKKKKFQQNFSQTKKFTKLIFLMGSYWPCTAYEVLKNNNLDKIKKKIWSKFFFNQEIFQTNFFNGVVLTPQCTLRVKFIKDFVLNRDGIQNQKRKKNQLPWSFDFFTRNFFHDFSGH